VRKEGTQQIYLLSNNHVLGGCNHVPQNQPILSPSSNDSRADLRAPTEIGRHAEIHELRTGDPSFVNPCEADLALARATNPTGLSSWQGEAGAGYDTPTRSQSPVSRMLVKKVGRTTGLTHGVVQSRIPTPRPTAVHRTPFQGGRLVPECMDGSFGRRERVCAPRRLWKLGCRRGRLQRRRRSICSE
jgi:hypothetical protein